MFTARTLLLLGLFACGCSTTPEAVEPANPPDAPPPPAATTGDAGHAQAPHDDATVAAPMDGAQAPAREPLPEDPDATAPIDGSASIDADPSDPPDGTTAPAGDAGGAVDAGPDPQPDADAEAPTVGDADPGTPPERGPRPLDRDPAVGPLDGGQGPLLPLEDVEAIEAAGFQIAEFRMEGEAFAFEAVGAQGIDGKWQAQQATRSPYQTRLVVVRPPAEQFNGTVLVEWLNVTTGRDLSVAYRLMAEEFLRGGYGYVGVSLQSAGIDALKSADAARYGRLSHPGDPYSYDILSQVGLLLGWPEDVALMGALKVERVLAYGQSQSAMRMVTYANAIHHGLGIFDGFFIHSRSGFGAPIGDEYNALLGNGEPVWVREDIEVPVLQFFTESEMFMPFVVPGFRARQPDSDHLRTWEVAATAHADRTLVGDADSGCGEINDGPQHFVAKAALRGVHLWMKDGTAPPEGEPLAVNAQQSGIARDDDGNALGGVRTPDADVPTAMLTGEPYGLAGLLNPICMLHGQTVPFSDARLRELYPTHQDYVDQVTEAARRSREAGFLLAEEELAIVEESKASAIPN